MCVLHVTSRSESFSELLKLTRLPVYQSHEKGEIKQARRGLTWEDFGFSCEVSAREWNDFPGQVEDAIRFLARHSPELKALGVQHRLDDIRLDFPIESRLSKEVFGQFDYLPPKLVRLCADYGIGIELSHYVRPEADNCEQGAAPNRRPARRQQIRRPRKGGGR